MSQLGAQETGQYRRRDDVREDSLTVPSRGMV